jgi:hypothetical protein
MEKIVKYFIEEKGTTDAVAKVLSKTIMKYGDLRDEFILWLETRTLDHESPVVIEGYTAKQVSEIEPSLDVAGIYNFMVTLREQPDKAKEYIRKGFPRK